MAGPISHRALPCEEFSPGAVATIALRKSAPTQSRAAAGASVGTIRGNMIT